MNYLTDIIPKIRIGEAMMAMTMDQLELFPRATSSDVLHAKQLLIQFKRLALRIKDIERHDLDSLSSEQLKKYKVAVETSGKIERSVALILDDEVRKILEFRYLAGNTRKQTVLKFSAMMHDSTVDRKISEGIESVAESLLFMG